MWFRKIVIGNMDKDIPLNWEIRRFSFHQEILYFLELTLNEANICKDIPRKYSEKDLL